MALLLGWALAEESLNLRTFLASAIILGAVVLVTAGRGDVGPELSQSRLLGTGTMSATQGDVP